MRTLAIDCASEACSAALFDGDSITAGDYAVLGRGHAERLIPMIAALPDNGRAERILVSLGPGSFTGVRIGIAAARALGVAWDCKVLGYPTLSLVAMLGERSTPHPVTVCMNGGHGEWFVQNFGAFGDPEGAARSLAPQDAAAACAHNVIIGNRADELAALLARDVAAHNLLPDARRANLLRASRLTADLSPIYGREPDAKPAAQVVRRK